MELIFIKKIIDILVEFLRNLFEKKSLRNNCKEAGDLVSKSIQELVKLNPNINKVKSLLSKAEKLCPNESEDLFRAREMLETIQVASRSISKSSSKAASTGRSRRTSNKKVSKKKTAKKKLAKKKIARKKMARKKTT